MKAKPRNVPWAVLLATGSAGGTISAVRELSKIDLRAAVISDQLFCPAAWSRRASHSYKGPPERKSRQFLALLLEIGASSPGKVLLPTSDETAWLYAQNAPLLSRFFLLRQPPLGTIQRILDKKLLAQAAVEVGIEVLPTYAPLSYGDVVACAESLTYPIIIKPRAQVGRMRNDKGRTAYSSIELLERFREYMVLEGAEEKKGRDLLENHLPLLQHFVKVGAEGVCSVSGYIDETGELFVSRRSTKILQRSQPAGVGVCFESLPEDVALSRATHRLCRELGYFGIFEVEFIKYKGRWAIIDFNPRLFSQAGMDALRGMPLAKLAYLDAAGKVSELREAVSAAGKDQGGPAIFYDRFTLPAILTAKILTRRTSLEELRSWHRWVRRHANHSVDFAMDRSDRTPGIVHICSELILGLRAIPKFLRSQCQ